MMAAGRELDLLVAEKIMGWKFQFGQYRGEGCSALDEDGNWDVVPRYSRDVAAAWMIVHRIHARGFFWWMASSIGRPGVVMAHVRRRIDSDTIADGYATESTAHSICVAALKALEIQSPSA